MVTNLRMQMNNLAEQFIIENKMDKAAAVLNKSLTALPEKNAPYDQPQIMWQTAELLFKAGDLETATKLAERVFALNNQMLDYYESLTKAEQKTIERKMQMSAFVNEELVKDMEAFVPGSEAAKNMRAAHEAALDNVGLLELMKEERGKKEQMEAQMKLRDSLIKVLGQEKFDSLSNVRKSQGKF
jgi:tetratricopeptide (TPR) repeat protein